MDREFIIADGFRQADNTASIDWGWKRISNDEWLRPTDGKSSEAKVKFLPEPYDKLCGLRNCVVHVGWFSNLSRKSAAIKAVRARGASLGLRIAD